MTSQCKILILSPEFIIIHVSKNDFRFYLVLQTRGKVPGDYFERDFWGGVKINFRKNLLMKVIANDYGNLSFQKSL